MTSNMGAVKWLSALPSCRQTIPSTIQSRAALCLCMQDCAGLCQTCHSWRVHIVQRHSIAHDKSLLLARSYARRLSKLFRIKQHFASRQKKERDRENKSKNKELVKLLRPSTIAIPAAGLHYLKKLLHFIDII